VLFVFTRDRRIRAEVGYGLEEALPDVEMERLLDETAVPAFRNGDFGAGLEGAVARICERIRAVPPAPGHTSVTMQVPPARVTGVGSYMNRRDSSSILVSSACESARSMAPRFSKAWRGRLAPGITTTASP